MSNINAQSLLPSDSEGLSDANRITGAQILRTLWRRRNVVLATVFVITALGFLTIKLLTPTYTSEAIIVLSARQDSVVDMQQSYLNTAPSDPVVRSEVDALQSRTLVDRIIDREHLMSDPEFNLYIRKPTGNRFFCALASVLPNFLQVSLSCKARTSGTLTADQIKYNVATQVLKAYTVNPDPKTYSVKLDFTSIDAAKACRLANAFAEEYMARQVDEQIAEAERAARSMNPKLEQLSQEVARADRAVEAFKEANHIVDLPGSLNQSNTLALQEIQNLSQELSTARSTRAQLEAAQAEVQRLTVDPDLTLSAPSVSAAPVVENVRVQEVTAAAQLASLRGTYGERHPLVVSAKNELSKLQDRLKEEAQSAVRQLGIQVHQAQRGERQLQARLDQLTSVRTNEGRVSPQLRQLESAQTAAKTVYDTFVQGLFRAAAQNGVPTAKGRIVQRADVLDWPTFPNLPISMAIILATAILIAIGVVFALESNDQSFHDAADVEQSAHLPVLGMTLLASSKKGWATRGESVAVSRKMLIEPNSAMAESVRLTRTAIAFSTPGQKPRVVMVTSAIPSEGKTTFSLMLARQSAMAGSKSIVVEAELRRPAFERELLSKPAKGLADYLLGQATLEEIIDIDSASGTHFISSGIRTPGSGELLATLRMHALLRELANQYELVVIDTPPAAVVADALQLGTMVDAAILVVKWAATPRHLVMDALKKLRGANVPVAGVVMTQVDSNRYKFYTDGTLPYEYAKGYYAA